MADTSLDIDSQYIYLRGLNVDGLKLDKLFDFSFTQRPGDHAYAQIKGRMTTDDGDKLVKTAAITTKVKVFNGQKPQADNVLFVGFLSDFTLINKRGWYYIEAELIDASIQLDLEKMSASYQKLDAKYQDILTKACGKDATVKITATDTAIKRLILQLEETPWEFACRMASHLGTYVFTDFLAEKPFISVGAMEAKQTLTADSKVVDHYILSAAGFARWQKNAATAGPEKNAAAGKIIQDDFSERHIYSGTPVRLGDKIKVDKTEYLVASIEAYLRPEESDNRLVYEIGLGTKASFCQEWQPNYKCMGRMLKGQVKKVDKDKVQVHLFELDKTYDSSSTMWFPFATAYSSSDGSGWYVMPEENDYVRVILPTYEEGDAFTYSGINTAPLNKPRNKSFKAPGGKEILLTDTGVEIICSHQKIFASLDDKKGIALISSQNVNVSANGDISLEAKGKVQIIAKSEINIQSGSSHVKLKPNQIGFGGSSVIVGE